MADLRTEMLTGEPSEDRIELIKKAMEAAGLHFNEWESYGNYVFHGEGISYTFESWKEALEWIDGAVFDDPEQSQAVERILHPERYSPTEETLLEATFPYSEGDTVYLEDSKPFILESIGRFDNPRGFR